MLDALAAGDHERTDDDLVGLVHAAIRRRGEDARWRVASRDIWCSVEPALARVPEQGWKLHVAATASSAATVLDRALPFLLDARCVFKFAQRIEDLVQLNGPNYPREGAGKFITVYPNDDDQLRTLARQLDGATSDLAAPAILSDRPIRPGSAVHYRYGAFAGRAVIGNDGEVRHVISAPDGTLVEDRREPRFTPPEWAVEPFARPALPTRGKRRVLLAGRYEVTEALRHANKGGVYRALDRVTGATALIKEARPHTAGSVAGHDARDLLRVEAAMLERLAAVGIAPRPLGLFEQGGHLFLAEEFVHGATLRDWALVHGDDAARTIAVARNVAAALAVAHAAGVVVRDCSPNNVIVTDDDDVRLIDLEVAVDLTGIDDLARGRGTPAYVAPEQSAGAPPDPAGDSFSLGATIAYLVTAADPLLPNDNGPGARTNRTRLEEWLAAPPRAARLSAELRELLLALCDDDPARRPSAEDARQRLAGRTLCRTPSHAETAAHAETTLERLTDEQYEDAVDGVLEHVLATYRGDRNDRPWPSTLFGQTTDPCNVQHGAAGVVVALLQAWRARRDPRIADVILDACTWIEHALDKGPSRSLPGLYFGAAGIAWALGDAGVELDRPRLVERALELATSLDASWPSPDVTHGRAGLGLALLHLARRTGDGVARAHAERCAETLLADRLDGPHWRTRADFDSVFAGQQYHGFAHGTAGIASFLLEVGGEECVRTALAAGDALLAAAIDEDGALSWASGYDGPQQPVPHWCNGSSGVGTFLLRLYAETGEARFRAGAEAAARAVVRAKWQSGIAYCHGLPGNGDFLLDLARTIGGPYQANAEDFAAVLWRWRVLRGGRVVFADPDGFVASDFNVGLGGVLSFLLRMRHPLPRPLLPEARA